MTWEEASGALLIGFCGVGVMLATFICIQVWEMKTLLATLVERDVHTQARLTKLELEKKHR